MKITPKISIVTPSFNQGPYLEKAIISVLDQNYPNLEYIIIDGGSTDESVEIIRKYNHSLKFWVSEKDTGQSNAINKGLSKVTGDIVGWIGSDDWYETGAFQAVAEAYGKYGADKIIIGDCERLYVPSGKKRLLRPQTPTFKSMTRYWRKQFCPPQPSIFFPRNALLYAGQLDEKLNYGMDLDLWLRMVTRFEFQYIDQKLSNYLVHDLSKSGSSGGFRKFRKEWKSICFKHIKSAPPLVRLSFYFDFYYHLIFHPDAVSTKL